ncbi:MAG: GNAT family N-acetyltransferase [Bdellovibrio sp.]
MKNICVLPFESKDIFAVKEFTDLWIGRDYYSFKDLERILELSWKNNLNSSFLAWDRSQLVGVRLTFAPGQWISEKLKVCPEKWNVSADKVAYFKSLFIDEKYRSLGLGKMLSSMSKEIVQKQHGEAIVTHSWLESPGNSSQMYLSKDGFTEIARHEKFWEPIDYQCTRCSPQRCQCTAVEMIKYIS